MSVLCVCATCMPLCVCVKALSSSPPSASAGLEVYMTVCVFGYIMEDETMVAAGRLTVAAVDVAAVLLWLISELPSLLELD